MAPGGLVTGYQILRRYVPSPGYGVFRVIATTGPTATTYEDESVGFGGRYIFRVKAMYGDVLSPWSKLARAYVPEPPAAPEGLVAMEGDGMVTLTWNDPGDNTLTGYEVRYGESGTDLPAWSADHDIDSDAGTTTHPVPGLTNGIEYTFEVRPRNASGYFGSSRVTATPEARPPAAPDILRTFALDRKVTVIWARAEDRRITGYQIRYGANGAWDPDWMHIERSSFGTTGNTPRGLTNGIKYTIEVRAMIGDVEGLSSSVMAVPVPRAPRLVGDPVAGDREVTLTWSDPRDAAVIGYQLRYARSTLALPDWSEITDSGPNTTRHVVTGLTNRIEYTFEARAKAGMVHGDSARAMATPRQETVTPPPTPCQTLRIDPISNVTVNVNESFSRTASATGGCDPIRITMRGEPSGVTIPSGTGRSKTIRGPATVTGEYEVTVTATDSRGNAANKNFTITVRRPSPPICATITIHEIDDVTVTVGRSISIDASATGGCGSITFSMTGAPTGVTIGPDNGRIRGDAPSTPGTHRVTVTATDEEENTDDEPFTIVVPCRRVRIADIADMTVTAEARFSHTATVSGGCGTRTSSREDGPTWVGTEIDTNGNLMISGTAPPTPGGPYDVSVMVQDAYGNADEELFTISVETGLTVSCPENQVVTTGERIDAHATAAGGQPPYRFREPSIEPSTGLGLSITTNGSNGSISGTAGSVGDYRVTVTVNDDDDDSATCRFNVTVTARPCAVDVGGLSDVTATKGSEIPSMTASASRGESPYTYTMSGAPGTVEIDDESGVISGKVGSTAGEFDVTVTATDDFECPGTASFKITVECPDITVTQSPDPVKVKAGGTATVTVSAEGGCGTKTFGNPGGLGWVRKTGSNQYTVEPPAGTAPGPYTFSVTATDAEGNTGPGSIKVTVECPDISVSGLADVEVEVLQVIPSMTADASGGNAPYRYRRKTGPEWVNVSTAGVISGRAPNTTGEYTVRVKATDAGGCWGTTTFEIDVVNPPLEIADIRDVEATVGQEMPARAASASGGETPYVFTMSGKPSWVDFNRSSGRISGTPTSTGTSTATVTVTDKKGVTATTPSFQLRVSAPLTIASISDVVVTWQLDMNPIQVSASGGRGSYTYDLESEPAGISITSSGRIGGTPTQLGSATVTVVVDDEDDRRATTSFRMTVALPGDFNGDGRRDAADAKLFNKKMGLGRSEAGYDRRMDLNGDGRINYADFIILAGYIESDASSQSGQ